jgi:hypothetical protein
VGIWWLHHLLREICCQPPAGSSSIRCTARIRVASCLLLGSYGSFWVPFLRPICWVGILFEGRWHTSRGKCVPWSRHNIVLSFWPDFLPSSVSGEQPLGLSSHSFSSCSIRLMWMFSIPVVGSTAMQFPARENEPFRW